MKPVFTARVDDTGVMELDDESGMLSYLKANLAGKRVEVVVRRVRSQRSLAANSYYWSAVLPVMAESFGYDRKEDLHEALAKRMAQRTLFEASHLRCDEHGNYWADSAGARCPQCAQGALFEVEA